MTNDLLTAPQDSTATEMSVGGPSSSAATDVVVPQLGVLEGDEIVELLIKPSLWYVLALSIRWLCVAGVAAGLAALATDSSLAMRTYIIQVAAIIAAARVGFAILQWSSRFYLLTNRRIMRIKGVLRADWRSCPLKNVGMIARLESPGQRIVGLGAMRIQHENKDKPPIHWNYVRKPNEVERILQNAVKRAKSGNGHS